MLFVDKYFSTDNGRVEPFVHRIEGSLVEKLLSQLFERRRGARRNEHDVVPEVGLDRPEDFPNFGLDRCFCELRYIAAGCGATEVAADGCAAVDRDLSRDRGEVLSCVDPPKDGFGLVCGLGKDV